MFESVVLPYINFTVFLVMAYFVFRKPLQSLAHSRYENYVKLARDAEEKYAKVKAEYESLKARVSGLDAEMKLTQEAGEKSARAEQARILSEAESLAKHLQEEARRLCDAEVLRAKDELSDQITAMVRSQVLERIKKEVSPQQHKSIVSNRMKQAASAFEKATSS